jgi:hypothetical protein
MQWLPALRADFCPTLTTSQAKDQQLEAAQEQLHSSHTVVAELRSSQAKVAELGQVQREAQELRGSLVDLSGALAETQEEQGRLQSERQALQVFTQLQPTLCCIVILGNSVKQCSSQQFEKLCYVTVLQCNSLLSQCCSASPCAAALYCK